MVGLGGGSALDSAKAVAVLSSNPPPFTAYAGDKKYNNPPCPIFAIPTTAGTGSEVSGSSVVHDDLVSHDKHSIRSPLQTPQAAAFDPTFLTSLPPRVIANSGLDALSHAIESYVSRQSMPITDMFCLEAIRLIAHHLPCFYRDPSNMEAAGKMQLASMLAGAAFPHTKTGIVHGSGNSLELRFKMPHGAACALLTPAVLRFTRAACVEKYAAAARHFMDAAGKPWAGMTDEELSKLLPDLVETFINDLGVATQLEGVTEKIAAEVAAESVNVIHCKMSPVIPTEEDLYNLVLSLRKN